MNKLKSLLLVGAIATSIGSVAQETNENNNWHLEDFGEVRGINVDKAYNELLVNKTPKEATIVAVIDSGVDINHEDLKDVIWVNEDEIPNNGIDDDDNGFIDDVNGWNFIGGPDGAMVGSDNLEVSREYRRLSKKWNNKDYVIDELSKKELKECKYWQRVKNAFEEGRLKADKAQKSFDGFNTMWEGANAYFKETLSKDEFSQEDVEAFQPTDQKGEEMKTFMMRMYQNGVDQEYIDGYREYVESQSKWHYNPDVDVRRDIIKDNPDKFIEKGYGNNNVYGPDASHGTHVAGIIAAVRDNGIGMNGVANNVQIMVVRAVPGGDEHDKDVANAIRYAVDNGARVINMSFGKSFSPNEEGVSDAIEYAEKKGVLMVHAAGNSSLNLDEENNYPTNYSDYICGRVKTFITVGASSKFVNEEFAAGFTNYGDERVDIFAPGVNIYATYPESTYNAISGTSMASPVVAGVAALIMSYYPDLSAKQVKKIIEKTGRDLSTEVVYLPGSGGRDEEGNDLDKETIEFEKLSKTNKLIDAYEALKLADKKSKY